MTTAEEVKLGKVVLEGLRTNHSLTCDAVAVDGNDTLLLASVVGPESTVKAFRAVLQSNAKVKVTLRDLGVHVGWRHGARRHENGYKLHRARLSENTWHVLAVAKDADFVVAATDEALWQEFRSPRFTTPLLRGWVPWLKKKLEAERKLVYPRQCGCNVALLVATDEDLDRAVERRGAVGSSETGGGP